ncbi:MAG: gamma-glutamyltransferase family protein [Prolixibacteraceae bacterium]
MSLSLKTIEDKFKADKEGKCAIAKNAMVSSASKHATKAGIEVLKKGGNAVDAAAAAALGLAVSEPQGSGMGGQTMIMLSLNGKSIAIDGSSRAPSLAHVSALNIDERRVGYRATTVPSTPATLAYAVWKYGRLKWEEVLEPAIKIAEEGFPITKLQHKLQKRELPNFEAIISKSGAKYFLKDNKPYNTGENFKQPDLANMLKRLAKEGVEDFYNGKIAKMIDADMRENGGLLRADDLALIPWPIEREPLSAKFRGLRVDTMPPPGAGKPLLFVLSMLDMVPDDFRFDEEFQKDLLLVHVIRKALLERDGKPYHPLFSSMMDTEVDMLNKEYIRQSLDEILEKLDIVLYPTIPTSDEQKGETTHLSVIDSDGFAVSLTQSVERVYGSKAAAEGLGFLYNNYLDDFDYEKPEHPYYLRPNHVPWATVSPSLIYDEDGSLWIAIGSPGSERVLSALTQFLLNITEHGMSIDEAMKAPRLHCSMGGLISLETERFPAGLTNYLSSKGYRIDELDPYAFYIGALHGVLRKKDGSGFQGIADVRRDGLAEGI